VIKGHTLSFDKVASTFYPILERTARDFGTILASSVPFESVFSIAELQITKDAIDLH
jgi:hypothetical protein